MTTKPTQRFTPEELAEIGKGFENKRPEDVLDWAFANFGDRVAMAASFGGASGAVLVDMAARINPRVKVFYLDTDFLFPETYANVEETIRRYGINPIAFKSSLTPKEMAQQHGLELWKRDPDLCCQLRKVEPNARALAGLDAWITGIRRDQSGTREHIGIVEWNVKFSLVKINPVAHWDKKQVWGYIAEHKLAYNALLDRGYKSIGCIFCTQPVGAQDDERAGRWAGTGKTECGLHS